MAIKGAEALTSAELASSKSKGEKEKREVTPRKGIEAAVKVPEAAPWLDCSSGPMGKGLKGEKKEEEEEKEEEEGGEEGGFRP